MSPAMRMSAERRRELVLAAAQLEFAANGYEGATTEAIARRVGVSQPYLFRLFASKRAIFIATSEACFDRIVSLFESAGRQGLTGEAALAEMGRAYSSLLDDKSVLQMQLHMWATACYDTEVRDVARRRMAQLWQVAERISGANDQRITQFLAGGMLLNIVVAMDLPRMKEQLGESLNGLAGPSQP